MTPTRDLAILVPVLRRPRRVAPLLATLAATIRDDPVSVVFIADPDDHAEHVAVQHARVFMGSSFGVRLMICGGTYPEKINEAVRHTEEPYIFFGADDLHFRAGWYESAKKHIDAGAEVVGVNDLIPRRPTRREHATHFLVTRRYALQPTIDGGRGPFHTGYSHNFCDDEFIGTAKRRGVYVYAEECQVQHQHPMVGGADDEVYERGRASWTRDKRLYQKRVRLWT